MKRLWFTITALVVGLVTVVALVPTATAKPSKAAADAGLGATTVTTAPGIVDFLAGAGVTASGVGNTGVEALSGDQAAFTFPITKNTADLSAGTGHIRQLARKRLFGN